jgi:hypothetical protein
LAAPQPHAAAHAPKEEGEETTVNATKSLHWMALALTLMMVLLASLPSFSQGCALCYTQAASASTRMIQALRSGILILIIPPTFMSVGLIFVVWRKNGQVRRTDVRRTDDKDDSEQDW